jgi:hypothetical protein
VTALSLTACVILIALWVRSNTTRNDFWYWKFAINQPSVVIGSISGQLLICLAPVEINLTRPALKFERVNELFFRVTLDDNDATQLWDTSSHWPIRIAHGSIVRSHSLEISYWFLTLGTAAIAVVPWIHRFRFLPKRFSLRTMFVVSTVLAITFVTVHQKRMIKMARDEYEVTLPRWQLTLEDATNTIAASEALLEAESSAIWISHSTAVARHLKRLDKMLHDAEVRFRGYESPEGREFHRKDCVRIRSEIAKYN